jgi:C-terminal processing protease CtpA/Prc
MAPGAAGAVDTAPVSVDIDDTDIANVSPNAGVSRARRGGEGTSFTFTAGAKAGTAKATMTIAGEPFSIVIINAGQ